MKMLPFTFRVAGKENGFLNLAHFSSNGRRSRAWTAPRWRSWRCCRSTPARVSCSRRLCTRRSRCAAPPTTGIEFHRFYWFTPLKTKVFTEECGPRVGSSWTPGRESCFRYKENHSLNCEEIVTLTVDPWGSTAPLSREAFLSKEKHGQSSRCSLAPVKKSFSANERLRSMVRFCSNDHVLALVGNEFLSDLA